METYKIYIFGIVALALALAALSFHLLSDKRKKRVAQVKLLTIVYVYVFFFMIVLMLLIMIEFYKGPQVVLANNDNYKLVVKEHVAVKNIGEIDPEEAEWYFDPANKFFLSRPQSEVWQEAKVRNGLMAYLEQAGLETGRTNVESFIKWNPYREALACVFNDISVKPYDDMMMCLNKTMLTSSFGMMLQMSSSTIFEYGEPINIQISPEFRTPLTGILPAQSQKVPDSLRDTLLIQDVKAPKYVDLSFVNYLNITVLDKSKVPLDEEKMSLANYFLKNMINLSSNAEKIIANENMMLFTSSLDFENARFGDLTRDFRIHRWVRMIEEPTMLFIIEMTYCPDTDENMEIWNDQKRMFESFGLLWE